MVRHGVTPGGGVDLPERVGEVPRRARRELREALTYARRVTRRHSSTFYLASRLFGPRARDAVLTVYAVCRTGDDAVDTARSAAEARRGLEAWWEGVERAYAHAPDPSEPLEVALSWSLERYRLPLQAFEELRRGLEQDLAWEEASARGGIQTFTDVDDLMAYCYRVAGVVGLLVAPIAGYRGGEATLERAVALGQAMQLTNILRDVGEDLERGRCYLPDDLRQRHGVNLEGLRRGEIEPGYRRLIEELAARAEGLYREAWPGIASLRGASKLAVAVAALNYHGILGKVRQNGYDNLGRRAYLRGLERLATLPRAVATLLVSA